MKKFIILCKRNLQIFVIFCLLNMMKYIDNWNQRYLASQLLCFIFKWFFKEVYDPYIFPQLPWEHLIKLYLLYNLSASRWIGVSSFCHFNRGCFFLGNLFVSFEFLRLELLLPNLWPFLVDVWRCYFSHLRKSCQA